MQLTPENKVEIRARFASIETVEELAELLSWIYKLKFPKRNSKSTIVIEAKHLNYYAFVPENRYRQFTIPKKSGSVRQISAPRYKLKTIQKCINEILNAVYTPLQAVTGFIPNKSIVDNAKIHVGKQFVYNTDLKDFFPSSDFRRIKTVLGFHPFNLSDDNELHAHQDNDIPLKSKGREYLGYIITNLCCENGCLPQGAPTSPTLTNIICKRLDKKLTKFAKQLNATYTRYADDITFSANRSIFDENFRAKLIDIIENQENFKINFTKERLQKGGERQVVTGIVVNRKCNVDRKYIKDIRFWLWCWRKYDSQATQKTFEKFYPEKKGIVRRGGKIPSFHFYLKGKILFMGMVRGNNDEMFLKFKAEFDELLSKKKKLTRPTQNIETSNSKSMLVMLKTILDVWSNNGIEDAITYHKLWKLKN